MKHLLLDVAALTVDTFDPATREDEVNSPFSSICDFAESVRLGCHMNGRTEVCITPRCNPEQE
jgi:hypothetical protein